MLRNEAMKVYLYCGITDMRKSINTLAILVQDTLELDPSSGHLFLFRNRGRDKLKALYYDDGSYTLWYRRLEKGKFIFPSNDTGHIELDEAHFDWLLSSNKYSKSIGEEVQKYRDFY